ncbi:TlpA family protein disulfide reductase [Streptomyces chartreusis]|uniref:TlpA family protein disulfide reductase n=1 Tax=Streptomyces chartreusis TaxID=1969 RepID=UPI00342E2CDC
MANPLTGDFEAVLQVSGRTVDRLVASMHQNAGTEPDVPSFPHSLSLRIGDTYDLDGVRGRVEAQLGAPRVKLLIGYTDVFGLEVDVRARFRPDLGTTPLPEFIHGVVRARYRIHQIDPDCPGWSRGARDHLWIRVVKDSVEFAGTAVDEWDPGHIVHPGDEEEVNERIVRQLAFLLATRFEAAPHKVHRSFRLGSMRSLRSGSASAVALPLSLSGATPAGQITSLDRIVLDGSDFAAALRVETLMAQVEPHLTVIRAFTASYTTTISPVVGPNKIIHHTARVTSATAAWEVAGGDNGVIRIRVEGVVDSDSSWAPSISFRVNQPLFVGFDATSDTLSINAAEPGVQVTATGLFASQELTDTVHAAIKQAVKAQTHGISPVEVGASRSELQSQLRTLDKKARARFSHGVFTADGVVLHGRISLAPRHRPVTAFSVTPGQDGFSALDSWAPGGRIDSFAWSWHWNSKATAGSATPKDKFLLRRPLGTSGPTSGVPKPLPGLDGRGWVCVTLRGVQTDSETGALVPFTVREHCTLFGTLLGLKRPISLESGARRKRILDKLWPEVELPGLPEIGLVDMYALPAEQATAANTLIVHFGDGFNHETAETLARGLEASTRRDAGLTVVALFGEGVLESRDSTLFSDVEAFAQRIGTPVVAVEDVAGALKERLSIDPWDTAWRMLAPDGGLTWMHDGSLDPELLGREFNGLLWPSPPPRWVAIEPAKPVGHLLSPAILGKLDFESDERPCPPVPFGHSGTVIVFVHPDALSSHAQLESLTHDHDPDAADSVQMVAVVDGDEDQAQALMQSQTGLVALADPTGDLAERFGVRIWPTTYFVDGQRTVTSYVQGFRGSDAADPQPPDEQAAPGAQGEGEAL